MVTRLSLYMKDMTVRQTDHSTTKPYILPLNMCRIKLWLYRIGWSKNHIKNVTSAAFCCQFFSIYKTRTIKVDWDKGLLKQKHNLIHH